MTNDSQDRILGKVNVWSPPQEFSQYSGELFIKCIKIQFNILENYRHDEFPILEIMCATL